MQLTERLQPADLELAAELGIVPVDVAAPVSVERAVVAPIEPPQVLEPVLHVQPDVLYFTSDDDPDQAEAREVVAEPVTAELASVDPVRGDLDRLKVELGEDYRDFARAARLVVSTQYASAARLQRDLDLPYSRARRLLADLEQQHFVGPATGSLPRQVLLPKERLPEVEQLLAEV
jgi:DNA segregation ATPase FtsK/SpoIIIE-like protein